MPELDVATDPTETKPATSGPSAHTTRLRDRVVEATAGQVPATGLAVVRIGFSLGLLLTALHLTFFSHLIFDPVPYIEPASAWVRIGLVAWVVTTLLLVVGLAYRVAAVLNYAFVLWYLGGLDMFAYHADYMLTFFSLVLVFAPAHRALSIDERRRRRRMLMGRAGRQPEGPTTVSYLWYQVPLFFGSGLLYLDSVFYKLASPHWVDGLGMWLPASMAPFAFTDLSLILDVKPLVLALGYVTFVYEAVFFAAMWFRRARPVLLVTGIGLHLGILVMYPIAVFGFVGAVVLLLLVPHEWWATIGARIGAGRRLARTEAEHPSDDEPAPVSAPTGPRRPRRILVRVVTTMAVVVTLCIQIVVTRTHAVPTLFGPETATSPETQTWVLEELVPVTRRIAGITPHPVFSKPHFEGYDHAVAITMLRDDGSEQWLPVTRTTGQASWLTTERLWVYWVNKSVGPYIDQGLLTEAIKRYTAWWVHHEGRDGKETQFTVKIKPFGGPAGYRHGELHRQMEVRWSDLGEVVWDGDEFTAELQVAETVPVVRRERA